MPVPAAVRRAGEALAARGGRDHVGRGARALARARAGERGARRDDPARATPAAGGGGVTAPRRHEVRAALAEVLDPEYPVSLVDLGLIRGVEVEAATATGRRRVLLARLSLHRADRGRHPGASAPAGRRSSRSRSREVFDRWTRRDISRAGPRAAASSGVAMSGGAERWEVFARQDARRSRSATSGASTRRRSTMRWSSHDALRGVEVDGHVHRAAPGDREVVRPA